MRDPEAVAEAQRWLRWAEEDLQAAEAMLNSLPFPPRHACWHAQQAAEKAIKTTLVLEQIEFPFVHDLNRLRELVPSEWQVRSADVDLARLTRWAVDARYPLHGDPTREDAESAVHDASIIVGLVRDDLERKAP
jgi:HEPN domain-containing protein